MTSFKEKFRGDLDLFPGYAQTVADMNNDFKQDLILVTKDDKSNTLKFEIWTVESDFVFTKLSEYYPPESVKIYGQSLFADFGTCIFFLF
jgi:hypothetical protein